MLRIVIQTEDVGACIHANARRSDVTLKTFDISHPEIEAFLAEPKAKGWTYAQRQVIGVEIIPEPAKQ